MGVDADRRTGLAKAARNWVNSVGSALFSLLHATPIMDAAHFAENDLWGVPGCHGFIGPLFGYNFGGLDPALLQNARLFEYAAAMAPPGMVHLAKVTLESKGSKGWNRSLEIDGHAATYKEDPWDCVVPAPANAIISQFAVFHHSGQTPAVESRQRLDDAIREFVSAAAATGNVDAAAQVLRDKGFDSDLVHRVDAFIPLAFCRAMFDGMGVKFSTTYIRIGKRAPRGTLKLMSEPAFARARALLPVLVDGGHGEVCKTIAMSSSTFNVLNASLNAGSKPENLVMSSAIIPDPDADDADFDRARNDLRTSVSPPRPPAKASKPWWRFW
jgi:hypothetical protein